MFGRATIRLGIGPHSSYCLTYACYRRFLTVGVTVFLWSPYVIGQTIIFLPCDFYLSSFLLMAALCNRGAIIFLPCSFFLLSFFFLLLFFPRLISAAVDWMSAILLHMAWP